MRVFNFSPGPAAIPLPVLEKAQKEFLDFQGHGMSVIEMSHRGKVFESVYFKSLEDLRRLANIPERFDILYMTGGASLQFALIPMNLTVSRKAGYIHTGVWSEKAMEQAKIQNVAIHVAGDSSSTNHNHIPSSLQHVSGLDYLHMTSNNTIYGTQFHKLPDPGDTKLIIDMSSDFLSRPIDWSKIGMVYAGAQKNAGASGLTVVIIDKEYYSREKKETPTLLRYSTFAKNDSMYNTPPTFQIYLFGLIVEWIEQTGGLAAMEKRNLEKADLIYDAIDSSNGFYIPHAVKNDRSFMNITFNLANKELESSFLKEAEASKLSGLKGHRLVGGMRASVYNAMSMEGCEALAKFLKEFAGKNKA